MLWCSVGRGRGRHGCEFLPREVVDGAGPGRGAGGQVNEVTV
ncbi:hypothetical protein RAJCM14343_3288 [Rhodococcus aetherivorans]|uniref:Uncharacterized protein n=1 Tax=Rhodococcus aetherivorans TaxID=191292 RepID=A0ABQ0YN74_9NOCA|nr:hypothetical protein RAJCM14343_3288 [Rhodococcus aetherivorans]CCW10542.1 hypothetical protein EBESD8_10730 [Rhodococcus aetherivorans]